MSLFAALALSITAVGDAVLMVVNHAGEWYLYAIDVVLALLAGRAWSRFRSPWRRTATMGDPGAHTTP